MESEEASMVVEQAKDGEVPAQQEKSDTIAATNESKEVIDGADEEKGDIKPTSTANGAKEEPAQNEMSATEEKPESKVHISAHERDREQQDSRRVQEARKYNSERGSRRGGFRGRGGFKNNNRFDPSDQEISSDPVAIRKQIEFYFSDSNLLTDKFLFERIEGHKNVAVPIEIIHSFKRMQRFQPRSAIVDALKESTVLDVVEDDTAIQRKEALPEGLTGKSMDEVAKVHEDGSMARSVYVKGFGVEESKTQFDIEAFFANYGPTNGVRLRRTMDKSFKGSVFVEFDSEETAKSFLDTDPPPTWKGNALEIKTKKQYCDDKVKDINEGRIRRNSPNPRYESGSNKRARRSSPSYDDKKHDYADGENGRDWRQRRNEEQENRSDDRSSRGRDNKRSGRGRGGNRGGRGGRDRNDERKSRNEEHSIPRDPTYVRVTSDKKSSEESSKENEVSTEEKAALPKDAAAVETSAPEDTASKKRAREDDGTEIGPGNAKKVDVKEGGE